MSNDSEREIIEQLRNMPKIADEKDKDKLFQEVYAQLRKEPAPIRKKRNNRYLPWIATAAVLILVVSLPFLLTNMDNQTANDEVHLNSANDEEIAILESEDSGEITGSTFEEEQDEVENGMEEAEEQRTQTETSRVIHSLDNESQLISFTVSDEQLQYTIPLSFIVSSETEVTDYYNNEEEILASYGLGAFGELSELDLNTSEQASYLLYEDRYFIRIPQTTSEIYEAISSLQTDIADFNIEKTVPEEISFELEMDDETLVFNLITDEAEITTTMIESILLTAKSYGYQHVLFENMPVREIGSYQFSDPVEVPIGANPIIQNNDTE